MADELIEVVGCAIGDVADEMHVSQLRLVAQAAITAMRGAMVPVGYIYKNEFTTYFSATPDAPWFEGTYIMFPLYAFPEDVSDDCGHDGMRKAHISSRLDRFVIPKPDPLVEALNEAGDTNPLSDDAFANAVRQTLAARGLKIVEVE